MSEPTTSRTAAQLVRRLTPAIALVGVLLLGPGAADAGVSVKSGRYKGVTTQTAVSKSFRQLEFTVKKGKVKLITEPTVARNLCLSTPVFTLDGTPTKKLSGRGAFTFTKTFYGNKMDRVSGRFTSPDEVEGFVTYHFQQQDLCSAGKTKVRFSAKRK